MKGGRQVVDVTVKGGYSPSLIRVEAGTPVRLRSGRQDNSDRTSQVCPERRKSACRLTVGTSTLELEIIEPVEYSWGWGMNRLHGTLVAQAPGLGGAARQGQTAVASPEQGGARVVLNSARPSRLIPPVLASSAWPAARPPAATGVQ